MTDNDIYSVRLQLVQKGYCIIPTRGKIARAGWNARDYRKRELTDSGKGTWQERVERWPRRFPDERSTGIRIEGELGVIDLDINDPLVEHLLTAIGEIAPEVGQRAPTRFGGGKYKVALFVRIEGERFVRLPSARFVRPGDAADDHHMVEIFGGQPTLNGKCSRQFVVHGPHSYNDDGSVKHMYEFAEGFPALQDVAVSELPTLNKQQALAILDRFEELATEAGWVRLQGHKESDSGNRIYDITELSKFAVLAGPDACGYDELCELFDVRGDSVRVASNFISGDIGSNRNKCWVFWSNRHSCVAVFDHETGDTHFPVEVAPKVDAIGEALRSIRAAQIAAAPLSSATAVAATPPPLAQQVVIEKPPRPDDSAPLAEKAAWLLTCYGYCAEDDAVIDLFEPSENCRLKPRAFQKAYLSWREEYVGPRGGRTIDLATSRWDVDATRITIRGVRMRPDMPFPTFIENGELFKNSYRRPMHVGDGDVAPWVKFIEHLLPDQIEREWFCNWLAHKHRSPATPGAGIIMVAAGVDGPVYGCGRGFLRDILGRLLGVRYVRTIDFDLFTGRSSQGQYTDWSANAVLVTVNEAKDWADSGRYADRRAVYERVKELIDPRAIERVFTGKYERAFVGRSFASYLIFSNHLDALQIPENDRRVTALSNGVQMPAEMAAGLESWMAVAANITALAVWLEARSLVGFDVFTPLRTVTKATMETLARTELDEAFDAVRKMIGDRLFTTDMILHEVAHEIGEPRYDRISEAVRRKVRNNAKRVGDGFRMSSGRREWILAWRSCSAQFADAEAAREAVELVKKEIAQTKSQDATAEPTAENVTTELLRRVAQNRAGKKTPENDPKP